MAEKNSDFRVRDKVLAFNSKTVNDIEDYIEKLKALRKAISEMNFKSENELIKIRRALTVIDFKIAKTELQLKKTKKIQETKEKVDNGSYLALNSGEKISLDRLVKYARKIEHSKDKIEKNWSKSVDSRNVKLSAYLDMEFNVLMYSNLENNDTIHLVPFVDSINEQINMAVNGIGYCSKKKDDEYTPNSKFQIYKEDFLVGADKCFRDIMTNKQAYEDLKNLICDYAKFKGETINPLLVNRVLTLLDYEINCCDIKLSLSKKATNVKKKLDIDGYEKIDFIEKLKVENFISAFQASEAKIEKEKQKYKNIKDPAGYNVIDYIDVETPILSYDKNFNIKEYIETMNQLIVAEARKKEKQREDAAYEAANQTQK